MALRELADLALDAFPDADVSIKSGPYGVAVVEVYADDWSANVAVTPAVMANPGSREAFIELFKQRVSKLATDIGGDAE